MLPNTALPVLLPSRGAVIHKHIFSCNSSADDPLIADLVWSIKERSWARRCPQGVQWSPGSVSSLPPNARHHSLPVWVLLGISVGPSPSNCGICAFERVTVPHLLNSVAQPGQGKASAVGMISPSSRKVAEMWFYAHLFTALGANG